MLIIIKVYSGFLLMFIYFKVLFFNRDINFQINTDELISLVNMSFQEWMFKSLKKTNFKNG
jgi:hypothetical protein